MSEPSVVPATDADRLDAVLADAFGPESEPKPMGLVHPESPLGDFRLVREIGRGGMGIVYEAVQISLGRRVALKVLSFAATLDPKQLQRFKNEAQAAAHLQHQHIVPVYGVGCERGVHYYAMQYIEGRPLDAVITSLRGRRPGESEATTLSAKQRETEAGSSLLEASPAAFIRCVAELGKQAAEALEHAHQRGILHRDIKPANLMLDACGDLWITDFGLARISSDHGLTQTGDLLGTLRYMSPEQTQARPVLLDHRTDIFSLGVTLYELLTLKPAFQSADRHELLRDIAERDPTPPRCLNPLVSGELDTVVLKALAKDPNERYGTAQELADDLRRYLEDRPIRARRPTVAQRLRRWGRRHVPVLAAAAVSMGVVLLLTLVGLAVSNALISHERDKAVGERQRATERLYESLLVQAQATRLSAQVGARAESLHALQEAANLLPALGLGQEQRLRLRNEAIACLCLPELRQVREWVGYPTGSRVLTFDASLVRYVRGDGEGNLSIRRVADDQEVLMLPTAGKSFDRPLLKFSRDGDYLAVRHRSSGEIQVTLWDLTVPRIVTRVRSGQGMDFAPDGRQVAVSRHDGTVIVLDLPSGTQVQTFATGLAAPQVAFEHQGSRLGVWSPTSRTIQIWDESWSRWRTRFEAPEPIQFLAWHPHGRHLALAAGPRLYLWNLGTAKATVLDGHLAPVTGLAFHPDGALLASTSWDETLRFWDTRVGRTVAMTRGVYDPRFSADGRRFAVRDGERLHLLDVSPSAEYRLLQAPSAPGGLSVMDVGAAGRLLAAADRVGIHFWDLPTGREAAFLPLPAVTTLIFDSAGRQMIAGSPLGTHCLPITTRQESGGVRIGLGPPKQVYSGDGRTAPLALSRDGETLVIGAGRAQATVLDLPTATVKTRLVGRPNLTIMDFHPAGEWIAAGTWAGGEARVWSVRTGQTVFHLPVEPGHSTRVAFSPDGASLAVCTRGEYQLFTTGTWEPRFLVPRDTAGDLPGPLAFSADSRLLAVAHTTQNVRLVCPRSGEEIATLTPPYPHVLAGLRFSPDGGHLIASTEGSTIHVWDLRRLRTRLATLNLDWDQPAPSRESEPNPGSLQVELKLGELAPMRQQAASLRRILAADPNHVIANNNLAWLHATGPAELRDLPQALALGQKAVLLAPHRGSYWNTLGVVCYRLGRWEQAVEYLRRALVLSEDHAPPLDLFFLAMSYHQLGRAEEARQRFSQAVAWMDKQPANEEEWLRFRAEAEALLEHF